MFVWACPHTVSKRFQRTAKGDGIDFGEQPELILTTLGTHEGVQV